VLPDSHARVAVEGLEDHARRAARCASVAPAGTPAAISLRSTSAPRGYHAVWTRRNR
jgi:hypothetical protein